MVTNASRVKKHTSKEIKAKIEEGWIHVTVLFELIGNPKEHIEKTMESFLATINEDKHIITIKEEMEETLELEQSKGLFSTAAEVDYLILGIEKLTWFAFNFLPANIEIKAPEELTFKDKDLSDWMNDLLARLHEVNTVHTALKSEHTVLVKNLNNAIRNNVLLALETGASDAKSVSKKIGLGETASQQFLEALVKEEKAVLAGKKYKRK
jgi:hypothetical protein